MYITRHTSPVLFENSSSSRFNFTVDWLSFSYLAETDNPFEDPVLRNILFAVYPSEKYFVLGRGKYSFLKSLSASGCLILFDPAENSDSLGKFAFHVIFQGTGLKLARSVLLDQYDDWLAFIYANTRIVRLDLALDLFDCPHVNDIRNQFEFQEYISSWRVFNFTKSNNDGWTYSLGRRGGPSFFRVYNKLAKFDPDVDGDPQCISWLRFELELRDVDALLRSNISLSHFDNYSLFSFFLNFLSTHISIPQLPVCPYDYHSEVMNPASDRFVDPVYKSVNWLRRQVLPTIDKLNKAFGADFFNWLCGQRLPSTVPDLMITYFLNHVPDILIPFKEI